MTVLSENVSVQDAIGISTPLLIRTLALILLGPHVIDGRTLLAVTIIYRACKALSSGPKISTSISHSNECN